MLCTCHESLRLCATFDSGETYAQATAPGGGHAAAAAEQPSWLMQRLGRCAEAIAEELSAYTGASLQVFWAPIDLPSSGSQAGPSAADTSEILARPSEEVTRVTEERGTSN
jgi:hypothetical protein